MISLLFGIADGTCRTRCDGLTNYIANNFKPKTYSLDKEYVESLKKSFHPTYTDVVAIVDATEHPRERILKKEELLFSGKAKTSPIMTQFLIDGKWEFD